MGSISCDMATDSPMEAPIPYLIPRDRDRYTGANCPPEKRTAIVQAVLDNKPISQIVSETHSSPATVQVVRDQELPNWKQEQSNGLKSYVRNLTSSLLKMTPEQLSEYSISERSVSLGIVIDKIAQLDGEPSHIVEHRHSVDTSSLRTSLEVIEEIAVAPLSSTVEDEPQVRQITQETSDK